MNRAIEIFDVPPPDYLSTTPFIAQEKTKQVGGQGYLTCLTPIIRTGSYVKLENGQLYPLSPLQSVFIPKQQFLTFGFLPLFQMSTILTVQDNSRCTPFKFIISDEPISGANIFSVNPSAGIFGYPWESVFSVDSSLANNEVIGVLYTSVGKPLKLRVEPQNNDSGLSISLNSSDPGRISLASVSSYRDTSASVNYSNQTASIPDNSTEKIIQADGIFSTPSPELIFYV